MPRAAQQNFHMDYKHNMDFVIECSLREINYFQDKYKIIKDSFSNYQLKLTFD